MIALIDNYDSFSYNLYQMVGALVPDIQVIRNDAKPAAQVLAERPAAIILSPGPGRPADAGICEELAATAGDTPLLGVCLGHQALGEALGATVGHAAYLMHGKQSEVQVEHACPLFEELPETFAVGRYHSLAVQDGTLPPLLQVTARAEEDGEVMAVQHLRRPAFGVQFHPESILTPNGAQMLENFIRYADSVRA